jgi:ABC-type lipoprotein export system ATPase subunit
MIQLDAVSKHYRSAVGPVHALDNISLQIERGSFTAVSGPSGCGKSTLLSLVGGLALPTQGTVTVAGQEISSLTPAGRAHFRATHVGFVFQLFHLLPYLNILENVLVAAGPGDAGEATAVARQLLDDFGLNERLSHLPGQLSAGERQRVAMARALLTSPQLLLADEPTGNLDPDSAASVLGLIDEYHRQGGTVLLVTHDDRISVRAEQTIHLQKGALVDNPDPSGRKVAAGGVPPASKGISGSD